MKIVSPFRSPFRLGVIFFYSIRRRCMQAHMSALLPKAPAFVTTAMPSCGPSQRRPCTNPGRISC